MSKDIKNTIKSSFEDSISIKQQIIDQKLYEVLAEAGDAITDSISNGGKLMICGNGGSAADAQHLAAEFLMRLKPNLNRNPIPAITLAQDTSTITACGNDFKYEYQFSRCLEALGKKEDVLIAISTSGNSKP